MSRKVHKINELQDAEEIAVTSKKGIVKEIAVTYISVLLAILLFIIVTPFLTFLQGFLLGIVTLIFIFVARWRVYRDPDPDRYHLHSSHIFKDTVKGILISAIIFPFFAAGFWFWNTKITHSKFDFSIDNYAQWPTELKGRPPGLVTEPGVYIGTDGGEIFATVLNNPKFFHSVIYIDSTKSFRPEVVGMQINDLSGDESTWELVPSTGLSRFRIDGVDDFTIQIGSKDDDSFSLPLFLGSRGGVAAESRLFFERGYTWLLMWLLTEIFLIALGEETFYRGYLQRRIRDVTEFPDTGVGNFDFRAEIDLQESIFLGVSKGTWRAIIITSILFAVGHLVIPINGQFLPTRLAVFFPSILFGWLKVWSGGLVTPIVVHGLSNMMIIVLTVHFF